MKKKSLFIVIILLVMMCFTGCSQSAVSETAYAADFTAGKGKTVIRILSESENKELETGANDYDAVWSASSIWISMGDVNHLVKHEKSISVTPVVFGVRKGLAEKLGLINKNVSVNDIL